MKAGDSFMDMQELKQLIYEGEKADVECKRAESNVPKSVYESYSAFANTKGGYIILGVQENKKKTRPEERFLIQGIENPKKQVEDFWNTINSGKVNINILKDEDVFIAEDADISLIVVKVPRADYKLRPVYVGENPYTGAYKRNNEGDYHARPHEVDGMIRDRNPDGNDGMILEHYTMDDIDKETLRRYRQIFEIRNGGHVWNSLDDKSFLEQIGGYRKDRREGKEGLTLAGLMMFGAGLAIRDEFDNVFMDYRDESTVTPEMRWCDRVTYDGTWENNLFNFFTKVTSKLTADLKKPFKLEGIQRIDETPVHKAVREAFVNLIIHADYLSDAGTLKIIKNTEGLEFTNPGILKLPIEDIRRGGNSKPRNPRMQTMLRMIGFGDNAGSGFPAILSAWKNEGWITPELKEDTGLNQVTLTLKMVSGWLIVLPKLKEIIMENAGDLAPQAQSMFEDFESPMGIISIAKYDREAMYRRLAAYVAFFLASQQKEMAEVAEDLVDSMPEDEVVVGMARDLADYLKNSAEKSAESPESAEKSAESAEKSAESANDLSKRQKQILSCMQEGKSYSTEEVAQIIGLKGPRTRQLLNELVARKLLSCTAATKNRRYVREELYESE
ncbi:MAG: putative DNA binding domain-containing protein [Butyrivibrio sp.]|nr:putative DNA binding domain-containing protein [Butyrivibrio sp.]